MADKKDAELVALEKTYAHARSYKRDELLFTALLLCWERPLPEWVFTALAKLLNARRPKISAVKERWLLARALLDEPDPTFKQQWERRKSLGLLTEEEQAWDWTPLKWQKVWDRASEILKSAGRPAKPETIRKSYALVERSLPPAQRRSRIYRRR